MINTKIVLSFALFFLFIFTSHADEEFRLILVENFHGPRLDTTLWDYEVNCWGGGNYEQQCYVNSTDNIFIENGVLNIKPIYHPQGYQGVSEANGCTNNLENSCQWTHPATSARIRTKASSYGSWKYGKFEFKAKMPVGNFLWPAIWMLPTDEVYGSWARSGEIDILEYKGQDKNETQHTVHYGYYWPFNLYKGSGPVNHYVDLTKDFHIYTFIWRPESLTWYVDDILSHTQTLNYNFSNPAAPLGYEKLGQPFDERFHILINLAVAGSPWDYWNSNVYGTFDPVVAAPTWTQNYQIDYMKVYELKQKNH